MFFVSIPNFSLPERKLRQTILAAKNFKSASETASGANRMEYPTPFAGGEDKR